MTHSEFMKVIDDSLCETLRNYSVLENSDLLADSMDYFDFFKIDGISKCELEIMRSFVGNVLTKYHVALQQSLKASGIKLGDLL